MTGHKILLFGSAGSGKSTLAHCLVSKYKLPYISTGNLTRLEIEKNTQLGQRIKKLMESKSPFPPGLLTDLIKLNLSQYTQTGFILDSYPKNPIEAQELTEILSQLSMKLDYSIKLNVSKQTVLERLGKRLICQPCNLTTTVEEAILKKCLSCGSELERRQDDNLETIKARFDYFQETYGSIIECLQSSINQPLEVDAERSVRELWLEVEQILDSKAR